MWDQDNDRGKKTRGEVSHQICQFFYREANRTADCLAKKCMKIINSRIWNSIFPKDVKNISSEDYCGSSFNCICKFMH